MVLEVFSNLSMYPYFDGAHYLMSVLTVREQLGAIDVARQSPIASWFSAMLCCFGGGLLSSLLLAEPPLAILSNTTNIIFASGIWYLVYYCPKDLVYRIFCFLPLRAIVAAMKEVTRTSKIVSGITQANSRFNDAWLCMIANGWAKAAGGGLISNFEQLVRGVWKPENNELLKMSCPVKISLLGAILFTLQQIKYLPVERHILVFIYTMFLITIKVFMIFKRTSTSPFQPIELFVLRCLFKPRDTPTAVEKGPLAKPGVKGESDTEEVEKPPGPSGTTRKRPIKKKGTQAD